MGKFKKNAVLFFPFQQGLKGYIREITPAGVVRVCPGYTWSKTLHVVRGHPGRVEFTTGFSENSSSMLRIISRRDFSIELVLVRSSFFMGRF